MITYGLIGYPLGHSFSKAYFTEKFNNVGIDAQYLNLEIPDIDQFKEVIATNELSGLNVTIPYKQQVIPFLDKLSEAAQQIGAVNTIQFSSGKLIGHNTDYVGFRDSLKPLLRPHHTKALVLGTGGSSKAVVYALQQMGIDVLQVSRKPSVGQVTYADINEQILAEHTLLVNTTPLGMSPNVNEAPDLPYQYINHTHLFFDLVYNPAETLFLQKAKAQGATVKNGLEMLQLQAEAAYAIWLEADI